MKTAFNDCLQFCCNSPGQCDRVCRNNPDYPDRVREIGTFVLDNVPRSFLLAAPHLPEIVPIIFHRTSREAPFVRDVVALPLEQMFNAIGRNRFSDLEDLCRAFGLAPKSTLILTGTAQDFPLEKWWGFGEKTRREIIRSLKHLGISLVTAPNYSLFIDRPRWDDLHSMKRIAIVHSEFLSEGLPCALHTNGRTETDFRRWAEYVAVRPEITHLAYEFVTGTAWAGRRDQHANWLSKLAASVERPLHLIVRGGGSSLSQLARSFTSITYLDTSIFMKTMMRQRAFQESAGKIAWKKNPLPHGCPVDSLLTDNDRVLTEHMGAFFRRAR